MIETVTAQNCSSRYNCTDNKYCCTLSFNPLRKECRGNCIRKLCRTKEDCGSDRECCSHSNKCTTWKADCDCRLKNFCKKVGLHCCKQRYENQDSICLADCIGQQCHENEDCAPGECCSRTYRCTRDMNTCIDVCGFNENCFSSIRPFCCGQHSQPRRFCSNTCLGWECTSDSECGDPKLCCISNYCTDSGCKDPLSSLLIVIILSSVVAFAIISTVIVLITCYRKRRGGCCVLLKPRNSAEAMELREDNPLRYESDMLEITPPPPYSESDEPFPDSHNEEFPPIYESQDLPT